MNEIPTRDDFPEYIVKAAHAAAALHDREQPQDTPPSGIPDGPPVLHIYVVNEPAAPPQADAPVVESTLEPTPDPLTDPDTGEHETPLPPSPPNGARLAFSRKRWVVWTTIGMCLVLALVNAVLYLPWLIGGASVTVTLIPDTQAVTTTISVPLSTSGAARGMLPGRMLAALSLTQAQTVPTTGVGHQAAEPGRGRITFYNAAPAVQTIPAGTLLVGRDDMEVVTDADAAIPGAAFPTDGQVSVPAHTVNTGPSGNIGAEDLYGACCREGVYVQNTAAFRGGQDARTFPMVTYQDVAKAEAALRASLMQSVQAAFQAELAPTESLITPIPCKENVAGSAGIGEEATSVMVQLTETCADVAYDTTTLTALVTGQLNQQAGHRLGNGCALVGNVTIQVQKVTTKRGTPSILLLTVKGTGTWVYQFSEDALQQMTQAITGKSASQATSILLHQPGVSQVELGTSGTLPTSASRIHVLVVEQGMEA